MAKSKQSICLLRPPGVEAFRLSSASLAMPLGLAYLAGSLEAEGIDYSVLDTVALAPTTIRRYHKGYLVGLPLEEISSLIPSDATLLGVGVTFTHEWPAAARLIDLIRAVRPDLTIVCGGEHITSMPEFSLATSKADFLVLGEGEETLIELVRGIENGTSFDEIDGLVIRDGNSIIVNKRRPRRTDLNNIPWPAWHRFDVEAYSRNGFVGGMEVPDITLPLLASRGCPYQCTFCSSPNMWTTRWTAHDPKLVVDEIEHYVKSYGARNFPFQDLTAIIKKDWIVSVCNEIIERKLDISWQLPTGTRSEAIDWEVAQLLKRSGQIAITYAPESGSERTRHYIKKKVNAERMVASVRDSATADLNVLANVIIGFPHETEEFIAENIPFVRRLKTAGCEDLAVVYYMALPGTEIFHSLFDAGKLHIDGAYFRHILHGVSLWPSMTFNDGKISKLTLLWWKVKISLEFYRTKGLRERQGGLFQTLRKVFSGIFTRKHDSRLQSAIGHALKSSFNTIKVQFGQGWMDRSEEERFFHGWHEIYASIRRQLIDNNVCDRTPKDTLHIHTYNVVNKVRRDHETSRVLVNPSSVRN